MLHVVYNLHKLFPLYDSSDNILIMEKLKKKGAHENIFHIRSLENGIKIRSVFISLSFKIEKFYFNNLDINLTMNIMQALFKAKKEGVWEL